MKGFLRLNRWKIILYIVYLVSTLLLIIKVSSPNTIQVVIQGERVIHIREIPQVYTFSDVVTIIVLTVMATSSGLSLVLIKSSRHEVSLDNSIHFLTENERKVYELIKRSGGIILQSDIVRMSNLSKSTISTILNRLEAMGLIEKRRRGFLNIIILRTTR